MKLSVKNQKLFLLTAEILVYVPYCLVFSMADYNYNFQGDKSYIV